jgi:hypothetical protein
VNYSNLDFFENWFEYSNSNRGLNGRFASGIGKDFEIKFKSKSEIDLGLKNKNMHAMKCNLSNYSKISDCYLGEMH